MMLMDFVVIYLNHSSVACGVQYCIIVYNKRMCVYGTFCNIHACVTCLHAYIMQLQTHLKRHVQNSGRPDAWKRRIQYLGRVGRRRERNMEAHETYRKDTPDVQEGMVVPKIAKAG